MGDSVGGLGGTGGFLPEGLVALGGFSLGFLEPFGGFSEPFGGFSEPLGGFSEPFGGFSLDFLGGLFLPRSLSLTLSLSFLGPRGLSLGFLGGFSFFPFLGFSGSVSDPGEPEGTGAGGPPPRGRVSVAGPGWGLPPVPPLSFPVGSWCRSLTGAGAGADAEVGAEAQLNTVPVPVPVPVLAVSGSQEAPQKLLDLGVGERRGARG